MLTQKEATRLRELEGIAQDNYLSYAEYYAEDYLSNEEAEEYVRLQDKEQNLQ
jgi:hypothetical protein